MSYHQQANDVQRVMGSPQMDQHRRMGFADVSRQVAPPPTPTTTDPPAVEWVKSVLQGLFRSTVQGLGTLLQGTIDWLTGFGFMFVTPKTLSYDHDVVKHLHGWMLSLLDGLVALILVIGGYRLMLGVDGQHDIRTIITRTIVSAIVANFSLFLIGQAIELQNTLCLGVQGALATAGIGDLSFPWGLINWATSPEYELFTYLIELILALLLILQMLLRLALLNLLIITAPLGLMLFWRLWVRLFIATLSVQLLQILCIGMGSAMIASFGHGSITVVTIFVGIATLFLAFRLPGMLQLHALQSNMGSMVGNAIISLTEYKAVLAAAAI